MCRVFIEAAGMGRITGLSSEARGKRLKAIAEKLQHLPTSGYFSSRLLGTTLSNISHPQSSVSCCFLLSPLAFGAPFFGSFLEPGWFL